MDLCCSVFVLHACVYSGALRGWAGFPSPERLTHTPAVDWQSVPADKPWSPLYLLPDYFVSTAWYMAPAIANLFNSFLMILAVNFTKRSNLVPVLLPSVLYLVSSTSSSISSYPTFLNSAANSLALSSPDIHTTSYQTTPPLVTSPPFQRIL